MVDRASESELEGERVIVVADGDQVDVVKRMSKTSFTMRATTDKLTSQDWEQADVILDANAWRFLKHRFDPELVELEQPDESGIAMRLTEHVKIGGKPYFVEKPKPPTKQELRPWAKFAIAVTTTAFVFVACAVAFGALAFAIHYGWLLGWRLAQ